ncbi:MAG: molecular chaperone TorD family protein, partial [Candidatus Bathyarchaeia archaeon]
VKGLPHPSESAYKSGFIMERPMEEVLKAYREAGVDLKEDFKEPADHISTELQFMAYLCQKASESGLKGKKDELKRELERRIEFLNKHLLPWIPLFAKTISNAAETDFYRGLVILTKRFVELDESLTKYMLAKLP